MMLAPVPESAFVIVNRKLWLPNTSFDTLKEIKLTYNEWCKASANIVDAMQRHLQAGDDLVLGGQVAQAIADCFQGHFKYLRSLPNCAI